jgi:hypothetical protein
MAVRTTSGTKLFIGAQSLSTVDTLLEYETNTATAVEIKEAENLGDIGDESPLVTFAAIGDNRIRNLKGARNAGVMTVVCGRDSQDPGQAAVIAAEKTPYEYAFKLEFNDAPIAGWSNTIQYFRALVSSRRENLGTNDNVTRRTYNIAVNSDIIEDPAAAP